jgi:hypothetical protein
LVFVDGLRAILNCLCSAEVSVRFCTAQTELLTTGSLPYMSQRATPFVDSSPSDSLNVITIKLIRTEKKDNKIIGNKRSEIVVRGRRQYEKEAGADKKQERQYDTPHTQLTMVRKPCSVVCDIYSVYSADRQTCLL